MTGSGTDISVEDHHVSTNSTPMAAGIPTERTEENSHTDSLVAEVHLVHESLALAPTLAAVPSASVVVDSHVGGGSEARIWFLSVATDDFGAFDDALAVDDTVTEFDSLGTFDATRVYRVRLADTTDALFSPAAEAGIRVAELRSHGEGWSLSLHLRDRSSLLTFRDYCSTLGAAFTLRALTFASDAGPRATSLTATQRETLLTAHEMGYYDLPRHCSQSELADALGVSASAISQRLRRASGKLVETVLTGDLRS